MGELTESRTGIEGAVMKNAGKLDGSVRSRWS